TCSTASTAPRYCWGCRRWWSLPSPLPRPPHPDRKASPDTDSIPGGDVQRIALGDFERVVPGVDVAQRRERADVARRMGAVDELLAQRIVAPQRAPHLRPAHEEALLAGEAVDHRCRLAVERATVCLQGNGQAAKVADVLAHRYLAVDVHVRQLRELVAFVLRAELGRLRLELARVLRGPPVAQQAVAVGFASLVVEAVDDLVADHATDAAVVHRRIGLRVEERRLQD